MFPNTEQNTQAEDLNNQDSYAEYLHQQLENGAKKKIKNKLEQKIQSIDLVVDNFLLDNFIGLETDYTFSFENLYVLRELGLLDNLNQIQKGDKEYIKNSAIEAEISHYSAYGFSLSLFGVENVSEKKQAMIEQLKQGSFWQIFSKLGETHIPGTTNKTSEHTFKFADDPLLNAVFLARFNLLPRAYSADYHLEKHAFMEWTKENILMACQNHALINEDGSVEKIIFTLDDGLELVLLANSDSKVTVNNLFEVDWHMTLVSSLEPQMLEVANQSSQSKCEAFINRPTGQALIAALDYAQLRFSKEFELFLIDGKIQDFSDRFGGPYTHLSRLLAKILWSGDMTKIRKIFVNKNNEMPNEAELKLLAQYPNSDNGLCAFQAILMQLIDKTVDDQISDIVATSEAIGVSDGACFDVASYYCQALNYGNLYQKTINNKQFLIKTHGSHTLINLTPIWFNGIELPKGSLFTTVNNDEFAFLRLTPFVFDNRQDMVSAFGTEIIKAENNGEDVMSVVNYLDRISI